MNHSVYSTQLKIYVQRSINSHSSPARRPPHYAISSLHSHFLAQPTNSQSPKKKPLKWVYIPLSSTF